MKDFLKSWLIIILWLLAIPAIALFISFVLYIIAGLYYLLFLSR